MALLVLEDRVTPATLHWIGGAGAGGNLWSAATNWAENRAPVSGDALVFDTTTAGFSATANGLAPQNDIAGLTNISVAINDASSAGDFAITGNAIGLTTAAGTALASTVSVGTAAVISNNLTLAANTTASVGFGTLTLGGIISGGFSLTAANAAAGTLLLNGANTFNGGTVLTSGIVSVGNNSALGTGTLTFNGGTLINAVAFLHLPNPFVVNAPSTIGGGSFLDLDGNGTLNANLFLTNNGFLGLGGAISGTGGFIEDGSIGSTTLKGNSPNTFTGGTTIISGGITLQKTAGVNALASAVNILGGSGNLTINANNQLNGGIAVTLGQGSRLSTNGFTDSLLSLTGLGNLDLGANAVNGLTVIGGGNQMLTGTVSGAGFFTYAGSGSYTFAGTSASYTGTLTTASGTLNVSANFSGAAVAVTGGTFGGTGAVKSVTATSGVVNAATAGTAGTLNTAGAVANSLNGATFRVDLGASGPSDHLALGTNATLNLTGATLAVNALTPTLTGPYQIITSPTGGLSGTFNTLAEGATFTVGSQTVQINYTPNAVTLTVVGATANTLHWTGAVSSAWGTAGNWSEGRVPASGDTLVFDTSAPGFAGTAAAFAPVNGIAGLSNLSIVINDASSAGDFNITGTGIGLTTSGAPAIASTVAVGNATAPGATIATPLALGSNTTMSVGLGTLTLSGAIGGGFALTANGSPAGTLVLGVANGYSGGTVLTSGTVSVGNNNSLGSGMLTLNGGTLANSGAFLHVPNAFVVNAPSTIGGGSFFDLDGNGTLNANLRLTNNGFLALNGALSGTGGLIEDGFPGGTTLGGAGANTFTGPISIISGRLTLAKTSGVAALASPTVAIGGGAFPTLAWGANNQVNGTLSVDLRDSAKLALNGFSDSIAALSGNGSIDTGSVATAGLTVTGSGANLSRATVTNAGLLTYSGTGSLTLGGTGASPSPYTGTLTAAAGSLVVAGNFSSASGLALTNGTLGGTGLIGTLKTGGTGTVNPGGIGAGGILSTNAGSLSSTLAGERLRVDLTDVGPSDQIVVGAGATLDLGNAVFEVNVLSSSAGKVHPIVSSATGGITGTFSGLPNASTINVNGRLFRINYTPNAVTLTDIQTITLTPASLPAGEVGFAYNQTITPTGGTGAMTLAVSNVSNPTGLMIGGSGSGTVTVSGTPTSAGTLTFTVTPTDANGPQAGTVYSVTVAPAVTLTPATLPGAGLGVPYNRTITPVGGTGAVTLAVSNVTNATGLMISGDGTNAITVSGTATATGPVTFTVTPTDSFGTGTATVYSFTVNPPIALTPSSLPAGEVGFGYNQTITSTGGTGPVTLAVSNVTNATGLMISGDGTNTITVSGTPTAAGTVTFTVTPSDSNGTQAATVYSFTVAPAVTLTPAALPTGEVGFAYNQSITPTGGTGAVTLAVSNVTNNTGLTIGGSGSGTVTVSGTPTSAGTVTFTVTPTDSFGAGPAKVYTFNVNPQVSLTPATLPAGQVGTAYNRTITPVGGVAPVTLTVSNVNNPTGLTVGGSGSGTITVSGTPTSAGTLTFTVTPTDANGTQPGVTYSITVNPAPPAPPVSPPPAAPPYYTNAFVFANLLVLQGNGVPGGIAVVPVPPGTLAFFSDVSGDGKGDVVLFISGAIFVIDGNSGNPLFLIADTNGDGILDVIRF